MPSMVECLMLEVSDLAGDIVVLVLLNCLELVKELFVLELNRVSSFLLMMVFILRVWVFKGAAECDQLIVITVSELW